jgi:NTE family protein
MTQKMRPHQIKPAAILVLLILIATALSAQKNSSLLLRSRIIRPYFLGPHHKIPGFVDHQVTKQPKVALVLSGGGARGIAAIGVFKSLEEHNIPIQLIVGTSMGSIAGGLYASGYTPRQLERLADTTNWTEVISYADESLRTDLFLDQKIKKERSFLALRFQGLQPVIPSAFSSGQNLTNFLNLLALQAIYHPNPSFDELETSFRAVSTDLVSGRQIVVGNGDIAEAMRGSMAVPLLFTPVRVDSLQLVDGGLIANIPVDVAKSLGADVVIALDVTSPLRPKEMLSQFWEVGDQIMGIMMQASNREQLAKADVVIRPPLMNHLTSDFTHLADVMKQGRESSESVAELIKAKIEQFREKPTYRGNDSVILNPKFLYDTGSLDSMSVQRISAMSHDRQISQHALESFLGDIYETGSYQTVETLLNEYSDSTVVAIRAVRYPILSSIRLSGNHKIEHERIEEIFKSSMNRPLNAHASEQQLKEILTLYREKGYSLARLKRVSFDPNSGEGTIDIDEGIIYRIDIHGAEKVKDYVIWRELPFRETEVFEISKIAKGIRNLNSTGLFERVGVRIHQEGENNVVTIDVRERSTELLRVGMRIDQDRGLQPSIDIRNDNFLGMGTELGSGFFGGLRNRNFYGEFKATRIFNSFFTFNLRGYTSLLDYYAYADDPASDDVSWKRYRSGDYREQHEGLSASFGTQLERLGKVTAEGRIENQRVWNTSGQPLNQTEKYGISSIKIATLLDTQDRFPFPREGTLLNISYESALVKIIEAVGFTKFYFSYETYQTAFQQTLHPKIVLGFADATLPITEQFSLGGQNNFFGLADIDSRGRQIFVVSLEYQSKLPFRLFFDTYFKARYDLGSIWSAPEEIRLADLRHGIGFGVALDTPVGPAEFSVGRSFYIRQDILDKPVSYGPFMTYFSIGFSL